MQSATHKDAPKEAPTTRLLDLSTDNLQQVLGILGGHGDYRALCSLSRTCRQLLQLVNSDDKCWEALCRRHWMIREPDPHSAPRMDTSLLEGLPGFGTFRSPLNSVQEDDQTPSPTPSPRGSHSPRSATAPACDREEPPVRSPKHRASDPVGTSTSLLSSTASGSARRAALALRLEQQQQQQQQQQAAGSPGASSTEEDSGVLSGGSSLASPAAYRSPGGVGGGRLQGRGGKVVPPWEDDGDRSSAPSAVALEAKGSPRDGAPPHARTSSRRRDAGPDVKASGQGQPKAASPSPTASLLRFGSMSAATSKAASDPRQTALHTSLSLGNGWHGSSSSMSISRRATYGGDILGLGARRTGIMLAAGANVWRQLCKDRVQGWRLVMEMLAWLQQHNHPPTVSGSTHRLQQLIALRYLMLFTQHPEDLQWRQSMIKLCCLIWARLPGDCATLSQAEHENQISHYATKFVPILCRRSMVELCCLI
ncbi:hypothetical protein DUNSADRAFT_1274 [Dunaliella salina]|uniref:F-box domain-containing protein n=1 Tax=Dunaliella salina TaxID=3046 RepID=A0ABQ7GXA4_DUNSA|nr:hypothetical protein DUNSADRAFT_1274 [Dunaliella salina]|eukprot:KAF5839241.1 hypothetical protein DUNSADRAFT_1274 [Dunaliella salina]